MSQPPPEAWYSPLGPQAPGPQPVEPSTAGWCLVGASALTLVSGFFPFWGTTFVVGMVGIPLRWNGWSSWWWIPLVLGTAVGVAYVLMLFGAVKPTQLKPLWLLWGALGALVLMLGVLLDTLISTSTYFGAGPRYGVVIAVLAVTALAYFAALVAQTAGAKLPFTVPGPR